MPRITRSNKAAALTDVTNKPSKPARKAAASSASHSINPRKRPLSNDAQDNKENEGPQAPKSKRRAKSQSSTKKTSSAAQNATKWDVEGLYKVTDVSSKNPIDTSAFILKVFYYSLSNSRQLYAEFEFDKLKGIMRLCPREQVEKVGREKFGLSEFEKACRLEATSEPGPTNAKWIMRWRGQDGGIREDKKVGGELNGSYTFEFEKDASSSSADFQGLNIDFTFIHEEHMFVFRGSKIANLDGERADAPWVVERKWSDLYNFRWSDDSDSDSDSTSAAESDSDSDSDSGSASEPGSVKDMFANLFTKNLDPLLKAAFKAGPETGEATVNCILNQLAPYREPLSSEPTGSNSRNRPGKSVSFDIEESTSRARKGGSEWDVTGIYNITCFNRNDPVNTMKYSMEIHCCESLHQLYATFTFDSLKGVMRMCPANAMIAWPDGFLDLHDFEEACNLDVSGVPRSRRKEARPGPRRTQWLMRWRGKEEDILVGGETKAQGQFTFKLHPDTNSTSFDGIEVEFAMVHKGRHLLFRAYKRANLIAERNPKWSLEQEWKDLFDSGWEEVSDPDYPTHVDDGTKKGVERLVHPNGLIKAKNKSIPKAGLLTQPLSPYIDMPPDWAWDVTGKWKLTCPGLAEEFLKVPNMDTMFINIFLANNPNHIKVGRQLWATFNFENALEGCMRFFPATMKPKDGFLDMCQEYSLPRLEKACVLKNGVWPGPSPKGKPRWFMAWRGVKKDSDIKLSCDWLQSELMFELGDNGQLMMRGQFIINSLEWGTFRGVKVSEEVQPEGSGPTLVTRWESLAPSTSA